MRAPGEAQGNFAVESAIDELSYELGMDPLELRRRNYAEVHPQFGLPWSSKALRECYQVGAERFGWSRRNPEVASMRDGHWQVGTAWPASPTVGGRSAAKPGRPCAATEPQWFAAPPATSAPGATR
jgi:CO/xanthine dehydrogenase Mo-binding subunit